MPTSCEQSIPAHNHTKIMYAFLISPTHSVFLMHPILLDLIRILFGEVYKSRTSSCKYTASCS